MMRKLKSGNYRVYNTISGEIKAHETSLANAQKQLRLLRALANTRKEPPFFIKAKYNGRWF
jgi:hypothetical protein